jgi:hypothetical protein
MYKYLAYERVIILQMKTRGPGEGQNLAETKNIIHMVKLEHKTFYCAYFLDKRMEGVMLFPSKQK